MYTTILSFISFKDRLQQQPPYFTWFTEKEVGRIHNARKESNFFNNNGSVLFQSDGTVVGLRAWEFIQTFLVGPELTGLSLCLLRLMSKDLRKRPGASIKSIQAGCIPPIPLLTS